MQSDFFGFTLIGLICGVFFAVSVGTMTGEWIGVDIGLLNLSEFNCLVARTGFSVAFAGAMFYLALFFAVEGQFKLLGFAAWHGVELIITITIGVFVILYKLDELMPWYRHDALVPVLLSLFSGLFFNWAIRIIAVKLIFSENLLLMR